MNDFVDVLFVAAGLIAALVAVATPLYWMARASIKRWLGGAVAESVKPYLMNDGKSVANYAREASSAALAAQDAAMAAQDAAIAAREAAVEARDLVATLRGAESHARASTAA